EDDRDHLVAAVATAEVDRLGRRTGGHHVAEGRVDGHGLHEPGPLEGEGALQEPGCAAVHRISSRRWVLAGSGRVAPSAPPCGSGASATAQALNSGIRECGSSAGLVSALAAAVPPQWNGAKSVSGRIVPVTRTRSTAEPRRLRRSASSPSASPALRAVSGCTSTK